MGRAPDKVVNCLRVECGKAGLRTTGTAKVLANRLSIYLQNKSKQIKCKSSKSKPLSISAATYLERYCGLKNKGDIKACRKAMKKASAAEYVQDGKGNKVKQMKIDIRPTRAGERPRWVLA